MSASLIDIKEISPRVWPLAGGVHPTENKHQSTGLPIQQGPLPTRLILPVSQHAGAPAEPIVNIGDKVLKGQMIAKAVGFVSVPVHAPTSGIIADIKSHAIPHPSGMHDNCIIIDSDGNNQWCELNPVEDYRQVEPQELVELIRHSGITGMGGAGFPTAIKLSPRSPVHTLILNGTECEPYITADDMLMRERAEQVFNGTDILMYLLNTERCLIGIEDNKPEAIYAMRQALASRNNKNIKVVVFPTRYPSGGEKQLIQILTGQEVPSGQLPSDLGIVVQNVGTAAAVHDAVNHGRPLISRITTLTGEALHKPHNLEVLLGTPTEDLLQAGELKEDRLKTLIMGGPMMGFTLSDTSIPVVKTSNCLIAGSADEFPSAPPAQACIRCGLCAEVCPSSLLPQQLYWHAQAEHYEQLNHHNLFDCIECGACSFVCPSSIPLVQYYRASKGEIRNQEAKHAKSERSKVRYENRQVRLAREKTGKEAKRKANTERAAKLKAQKAAGATASTAAQTAPPDEIDPVKAAIERAKAKKAAGAGASTSSKTELTAEQKKLKIDLSMANAQLKKTQRVLTKAEETGEGDITKLKANVEMLKTQTEQLQKQFDAAMTAAPVSTDSTPIVPSKPATTVADKKLKIEQAMAKAALKKAERALVKGLEEDNAETQALQEAVDECRAIFEQFAQSAPTASNDSKANTGKTAKPALGEQAKKLKIENAMAKAALKKAQRAIDQADSENPELETALVIAKQKAKTAEKALTALSE